MIITQSRFLKIFMLLLLSVACLPVLAAPPVKVTSADPDHEEQGFVGPVTIRGSGFEPGEVTSVAFLLPCKKNQEPCLDTGGVRVDSFEVVGSDTIIAEVNVGASAVVEYRDIEVRMTRGRGGKGTTLFRVLEKNQGGDQVCQLDFDATFDDMADFDELDPVDGTGTWVDGARSDDVYDEVDGYPLPVAQGGVSLPDRLSSLGPYYAFGSTGMRLDTNGSQHLERRNDTRFVTIDFSVATGECNWAEPDPTNASCAAGFYRAQKGVDMRIERQVQQLPDNFLCTMEIDREYRVSVGILFPQSEGGTLASESQGGNQAIGIKLNYGCQGQTLEQGDLRIGPDPDDDFRARFKRTSQTTWRMEGTTACVHTNLGDKVIAPVLDENGDPVLDEDDNPVFQTRYIDMPFGLTLIDPDAPPPWD